MLATVHLDDKPLFETYQVDVGDAEHDRLERLAIQTEDFFDIPDHLKREPGVSTT